MGNQAAFETYVYTSPGGRRHNEDSVDHLQSPQGGIWAVADGLGGSGQGERASQAAVRAMIEAWDLSDGAGTLPEMIALANRRVLDSADPDSRGHPMTTLVSALQQGDTLQFAHIGDSRYYLFRGDRLVKRSRDHSVTQAAVALGDITEDEIRFHPDRNRLLRALGMGGPVEAEYTPPLTIAPGDAFLLCSDGFWEYVYETEMALDLVKATTPREWGEALLHRLYQRCHDGDNYTLLCCMAT